MMAIVEISFGELRQMELPSRQPRIHNGRDGPPGRPVVPRLFTGEAIVSLSNALPVAGSPMLEIWPMCPVRGRSVRAQWLNFLSFEKSYK